MSMPDGMIRERTRQYGVTDDPFMGIAGSFQYAENLNVFDDPRGIKLSTGTRKTTSYNSCLLVSAGNFMVRIPQTGNVQEVTPDSRPNGTTIGTVGSGVRPLDAVIFNDYVYVIQTNSSTVTGIVRYRLGGGGSNVIIPVDRTGDTDIVLGSQTPTYCNCITNFNNSMLLVGNGQYLRVYNPAEDTGAMGSGWKIVKRYGADCNILDISPKADYVEIFIDDGYGNTKIHYYPGIFDMEDSGLMKSVELPNTRIENVYPHMTKEMLTIRLDGSNNNISLREVLGYDTYPVMKSHRAGLSPYDVQHKLGFFTGPCSRDMAWYNGRAYVADVEGIWEFNWYDQKKMPVGTLRWKMNEESDDRTPFGIAVAKDFIFVSYNNAEYCARIYDTANPAGYMEQGTLISRAIETEYGGEFTKNLTSWLVQFEMNNLTDENGKIEIYVCGNRQRNSIDDSAWVKIAEINQDDVGTCVHKFEQTGERNFMEDWQVIEYKVVITRGEEEDASPVLRSLLMNYDIKEKTNKF